MNGIHKPLFHFQLNVKFVQMLSILRKYDFTSYLFFFISSFFTIYIYECIFFLSSLSRCLIRSSLLPEPDDAHSASIMLVERKQNWRKFNKSNYK